MPSDVVELLSGSDEAKPRDGFGEGSEPGKVVPHVLTFAQILNTVAKTYSYRWDEALRNLPSNALAMRRDCYIRSLLNERKFPTAQLEWQIEVDNEKDANQKLVKDGLTKMVKRIKRFTRFRLYLLEATWYGRYGSQGKWAREAVGGEALWTFTRHKPVNGDKIQYAWDDTPAVAVGAIAAQNYPKEYIRYTDRFPVLMLARPEWRRQFIIHTHEVDDADYFEGEMAGAVDGIGLRSQIYWAWWLRDEMLGWAVDFMQKVGTLGLLIFWYEEGNAAAKAQAKQNAQEASTKVALVAPRPAGNDKQTWGVEHIPASTGGVEALQSMIVDYFERHIERLVIGQTLSAGTEGSGLGGTGVAKLHAETKYQLLKFDAQNLDETLTDDLVEVGKQLNYPWADFPVRFKSNLPDPDAADKLEAVTKVWDRLAFVADDVRGLTGMRKPAEDEETIGGAPLLGPGGTDEEGDGGEGDEPFGGMFGGAGHDGAAEDGKPSRTKEPWTIKTGPRKGRPAYKDPESGKVSDTP